MQTAIAYHRTLREDLLQSIDKGSLASPGQTTHDKQAFASLVVLLAQKCDVRRTRRLHYVSQHVVLLITDL